MQNGPDAGSTMRPGRRVRNRMHLEENEDGSHDLHEPAPSRENVFWGHSSHPVRSLFEARPALHFWQSREPAIDANLPGEQSTHLGVCHNCSSYRNAVEHVFLEVCSWPRRQTWRQCGAPIVECFPSSQSVQLSIPICPRTDFSYLQGKVHMN